MTKDRSLEEMREIFNVLNGLMKDIEPTLVKSVEEKFRMIGYNQAIEQVYKTLEARAGGFKNRINAILFPNEYKESDINKKEVVAKENKTEIIKESDVNKKEVVAKENKIETIKESDTNKEQNNDTNKEQVNTAVKKQVISRPSNVIKI